ncbi:MAG TPA: hypothetical protein VH165_02095, partial [Kofleriaceae bacterium]|nr:hypothetical protein [Kofleriaceae bacterium]
ETILPTGVGAYVFDENTARQIDVDHSGIEVETIDTEINALNRISKELYFAFNTTAKRPA